jgi:hypothetical protein
MHLISKVDGNGREVLSAVADGLLHYHINLDRWEKYITLVHALK